MNDSKKREKGAGDNTKGAPRRRLVMPAWQAMLAIAVAFTVGHYIGQRRAPATMSPHQGAATVSDAPVGGGEAGGVGPATGMGSGMEAQVAARLQEMTDAQQVLEIANGHADAGKQRVAALAYQRAIELGLRTPDVLTDLGVALHELGDNEGAVKEFREAAQMDPKHAESRYNLGVVLQQGLHDEAGARAAWEDFLKVAPQHEKAAEVRKLLEQGGGEKQ